MRLWSCLPQFVVDFCSKGFLCNRMGCRKILSSSFIILSIYLLLLHHNALCATVVAPKVDLIHRPKNLPFVRFTHLPNPYSRLKPEVFNDFIVDDDDLFELSKRQTSDDYGHLRFGKRGEEVFDDYGHMRFGRGGGDK